MCYRYTIRPVVTVHSRSTLKMRSQHAQVPVHCLQFLVPFDAVTHAHAPLPDIGQFTANRLPSLEVALHLQHSVYHLVLECADLGGAIVLLQSLGRRVQFRQPAAFGRRLLRLYLGVLEDEVQRLVGLQTSCILLSLVGLHHYLGSVDVVAPRCPGDSQWRHGVRGGKVHFAGAGSAKILELGLLFLPNLELVLLAESGNQYFVAVLCLVAELWLLADQSTVLEHKRGVYCCRVMFLARAERRLEFLFPGLLLSARLFFYKEAGHAGLRTWREGVCVQEGQAEHLGAARVEARAQTPEADLVFAFSYALQADGSLAFAGH